MFTRLRVIIRAKLSRFFDRIEDPGEMLDYSYLRQVEQLASLRRAWRQLWPTNCYPLCETGL